MTRRARMEIAVAGALGAYWGLVYAGGQFDVALGPLDAFWYSLAPIWLGAILAFSAGVAVGRWELLLVAVAQLVVLGALQLAGHVAPWGEAGPPLTHWWDTKGWWPLVWELVFPLTLGVLVRRRGLAPAARPS